MSGQPVQPRGATGRADLLRSLTVAPRDHLLLDADAGGWFGYVRQEEVCPPPALPGTVGIVPEPVEAVPLRQLPLQMPFTHAIVRRENRPAASAPAPPLPEDTAPLEDDDARPRGPRRIGYRELVPEARLMPALRRLLGATDAGGLDLDRLTQQLAAGSLPRRLPRRRRQRWHPDLVVVFDFSPRLWPFRWDMHRLAARLLRRHGRTGLSLRLLADGPFGTWSDWIAHRWRRRDDEPSEQPWVMPPPGTPVLIVGDLGLLPGPDSPHRREWQQFVAELARAQARPFTLAPLGSWQLDAKTTRALPVLRWSPDAPARPAAAHAVAAHPPGLDDLLALAATLRRLDPPLLRALRQQLPDAAARLDAGLEGALWSHADVDAGPWASVRTAARPHHLRCFAALAPRLQVTVAGLRREHHAHLPPLVGHEEVLAWAAHADPTQAAEPAAAAEIGEARRFVRALVSTLTRGGTGVGDRWLAAAEGILRRADAGMAARQGDVLYPLLAPVIHLRGDRAALPAWADPAGLAPWLAGERGGGVAVLVQDAATGAVVLEDGGWGRRQSVLGGSLAYDAGGIAVQAAGALRPQFLWADDMPATLVPLADATAAVRLTTASEIIEVAAVRRPRGVVAWGCRVVDGLAVESAPIAGHTARWHRDTLRAVFRPMPDDQGYWALQGDAIVPADAADVLTFGLDERFGVFADLRVSTRHGEAIQRLRWIEAGSFWMGSPPDEPERHDDEGPRHRVTLSRGFWLADTACTQALWRAVMGDNPSYFTGDDERPVEQVSWQDVQRFLRALEDLVPGCSADLPTEAEWEYACRAGTETPFSFGTQITPDQVNYNGNYPYAGGEKGLYREQTLAVKSLPPNRWGLYEMHGNVWEWCADGVRSYDDAPQLDPLGPVIDGEDAPRAVRGGSWFFFARRARSAYRFAFRPGNAYDYLGFRVCLRSIEPGPAGSRPGGPAQPAPGGRGPALPRDEAGRRGIFSQLADRLRRTKKS